ncbi:hypothetical protein EYF80_032228 [Liparis tanakae]|uniref:Uncharacterized protein n=1 Tax=Liparis tanakae TaxID=230148 RepID=A0A4Z2GY27_9TELE|nr:hypothetical protein EYF80_032228 [Liparis tanakae]
MTGKRAFINRCWTDLRRGVFRVHMKTSYQHHTSNLFDNPPLESLESTDGSRRSTSVSFFSRRSYAIHTSSQELGRAV